MLETQNILYGIASQTLTLDCPEGRPSSVTDVQVWEDSEGDTSTEESALTGSPSIESVSTTFDAGSGVSQADPTKLNLTATTNTAVDRVFLIANAFGQREWIEVARIDSGNAVYAKLPVHNDYASADTFVSTRISVTVDTTWASDTNNVSNPLAPRPRYRVAWTYVVSSQTYRITTYFDLVRYPLALTVNALDIDRASRGWLSRLTTEDRADPEAVIAEALQQVKLDLWEREMTAYALRNNEVLNELVKRKAVFLIHEAAFAHGGESENQLKASTKAYWDRLDNLVSKASIQKTTEGAGGLINNAPILRR